MQTNNLNSNNFSLGRRFPKRRSNFEPDGFMIGGFTPYSFNTKYITTKNKHSIPIFGDIDHLSPDENGHYYPVYIPCLSPESLKKSVKQTIRNANEIEISHCSLLNILAQTLGATAGFQGYHKYYEAEILPFMRKNDLKKKEDLLLNYFVTVQVEI